VIADGDVADPSRRMMSRIATVRSASARSLCEGSLPVAGRCGVQPAGSSVAPGLLRPARRPRFSAVMSHCACAHKVTVAAFMLHRWPAAG
jgi:hypothetical protein